MQSNRLVESMVMAMTASDIREAVDLFHEPGELLELRAFGKRKGDTRAGYFKDIDQFVKAAVELDQDPGIKGVYVVANVIKDAAPHIHFFETVIDERYYHITHSVDYPPFPIFFSRCTALTTM